MFYPKEPYLPWQVNEKLYPKTAPLSEKIQFLLQYAVLAPSTFNSQPWQYHIKKNLITVSLNKKRIPVKSDKIGRFAVISLGCFIENFLVAATYFGIKTEIEFSKNKQLYDAFFVTITVSEKKQATPSSLEQDIFHAIPKRVTNRSFQTEKKIPKDIIATIKKFITGNQEMYLLEPSESDKLSSISYNADIAIWSAYDFREEHVGWVRNNLTRAKDGMPAFGVGIGLIPSFLAKPIILSSRFAKIQAKKNLQSLKHTTSFVVLCSPSDPVAWVHIGMLYEKMSLFLTAHNIVTAPLGQFIENDIAQKELKKLLGCKKENSPQLLFRMGYPTKETHHSPRRPVDITISE